MSVEISGPKGYEYQYLLTAYLAISAYAIWGNSCQLIVEPPDSEDAELICEIGKVYIQAKSFSGSLDANKMLDWLEHTPRSSSSLWQRVAGKESRFALIVTSARCSDAVNSFRSSMSLKNLKHSTSPLSPRSASDILKGIAQHYSGNRTTIKQTAQRIVVWEQVSSESIMEAIREEIAHIGIVRSQGDRVADELLSVIRTARDNRSDCFDHIARILDKWQNSDLVAEPQMVIARKEIDELEDTLLREGVLLLHGRSQCGKTTTARVLLTQMHMKGFDVHVGQDVREASRVLYSVGKGDIVYLLDDPISQNESHPAIVWERLERFISDLPPHRYLIVTSRTDDLYSLLGESERDWCLYNYSWFNLTVTDREFLVAVWRKVSSSLSKNVVEIVKQHLVTGSVDSLLQPGQLRFLSRQPNNELTDMNQSMLLSKARFNSRTLANILMSNGNTYREVLRALSLVATHVEYSSRADVAYVLSDEITYASEDKREYPFSIHYSFGASFNHNCAPPQYKDTYILGDVYVEVLDALERQGLIQCNESRIRFMHPDYSEAAAITREVRTQRDSKAINDFCLRAIFCADALTASTAARSIGIEIQRRLVRKQPCEPLFEIALRGLKSLYPVVIDICIEILILAISELDDNKRNLVWESLDHYYADSQLIDWNSGQPWIVPAIERPLIQPMIDLFLGEEMPSPSMRDISSFATWYGLKKKNLPYNDLIKALEKPESFIRREAVIQLIDSDYDITSSLLDRVLDDHPIVVGTAIWALVEKRDSADALVDNQSRLVRAASRTGVAIVLRHNFFRAGQTLENYPAISGKARTMLAILQAVLEGLPMSNVFTNDLRLDDTLEAFTKVLPKKEYIEIARLRVSYLMQQLRFRLPDDYGLCVGDFILKYIPKMEPDRHVLLQELLCHSETAVSVSTVAHCVDRWDSLTPVEKKICLKVLVSQRNDGFWLKAAALTRRKRVPAEVLICLGLPDNFNSLAASDTVNTLNAKLLGACIRMYCGVPQPLWWIGLHHAEESRWKSVVAHIATLPEHDHFKYCIERCLYWACQDNWLCGDVAVRMLLKKLDPEMREYVVNKLFELTVNYNGAKLGDYWCQVFEVLESKEYTKIISKIVEKIDAVQYNNSSLRDLAIVFGVEQSVNDILGYFPEDCLMIETWFLVKKNKLSIETALARILSTYSKQPPRLVFVHEWIQGLVKDVSPETYSLIEKTRKLVQEQVFAAHETYRKSLHDEGIYNWHFCERASTG